MFSKIFLYKDNLLHNINYIKSVAKKPICVMVKANAYGHGEKEILTMLDGQVDYFGVACQSEGLSGRKSTSGHIVVFGKCENYVQCMKHDVSFALFSFDEAKRITREARKHNLCPRFHLCVNSGMNRYGFKDREEILKTINFLGENDIQLEGFYTHFSSLTSDEGYTQRQKEKFYEMKALLPKSWETITHVGGGKSIYRDFEADMFRTGIECYGYGNENVLPVLEVESQIVDKQKVSKGEHVGYLCGFTAQRDMTVATIPLGYADGLPRKLSNKFQVEINGKMAKSTGNVCMDAFMVDVTDLKCKIGDKVKVLTNASLIAPIIETTEYETLTNLTKMRAKRIIV